MLKPYTSIFMESYLKDLWEAVKSLSSVLKDNNITYVYIGGVARNQYGYNRMTEDIDILVDKADKDKMSKLPIGRIRELSKGSLRRFKLHNPATPIDVLYTGDHAGNKDGIEYKDFMKDSKLIKGELFLSLEGLIKYKLSSGIYGHLRFKDFDDIVVLIERNKLPQDYANKFRKDLTEKYKELWGLVNNGSN